MPPAMPQRVGRDMTCLHWGDRAATGSVVIGVTALCDGASSSHGISQIRAPRPVTDKQQTPAELIQKESSETRTECRTDHHSRQIYRRWEPLLRFGKIAPDVGEAGRLCRSLAYTQQEPQSEYLLE